MRTIPRVKQAESDQIVAAMKKKQLPVTYVLYPDEGHGFARPQNRLAFYAIGEGFLAKCLGGRYEAIGNDFDGSSLQVLDGAGWCRAARGPGQAGGGAGGPANLSRLAGRAVAEAGRTDAGGPKSVPDSPSGVIGGSMNPAREISGYRKYWAARFGTAPFLPMSRAEMDVLGWDSCDVIVVTGDAYVDHPSFGMAIVGRLLEAQGFRVGIIAQPDWHSAEPFAALGRPNLFFGITAGNMDSMVNRYTSDRRVRSDDAYTPEGVGGKASRSLGDRLRATRP